MSDIIILPEPAHCFALTAREAEEEINKNFMANVDICDTNLNRELGVVVLVVIVESNIKVDSDEEG